MNDNDNHEPVEIVELSWEASELLRRQREIDHAEAGAKLPVDSILYRSITLDSRWSVAAEFDAMKAIVDALPDLVRGRLQSIWCDSNAQALYTVTVSPNRWAEGIETHVRIAVLAATSGFNGLTIEGRDRHAHFEPEWSGDDYDYETEEAIN